MFTATGELHVWEAKLDSTGWPGADSLPAVERERATLMQRRETRKRWVAARWALRRVLGDYLDREAREIELTIGGHGKPALGMPSSLQFNLSHSAGLALVAVTDGPEVGIDVEWVETRRDALALASRALDETDVAAVRAADPSARPAVFHAAWTRREAIVKCLGTGLGAQRPDTTVVVSGLDAPSGFAAAVAVAADAMPPIRRFAIGPSS